MRDFSIRREYPHSPVAGVAAVVLSGGKVLLTQRGNEPSMGKWGLPGGVVELGETVEDAVVREVEEETGIAVKPVELLTIFNSVVRDNEDEIRFHYVLFEYLCDVTGGVLQAATDAKDVKWVSFQELSSLDITRGTKRFIERVRLGTYPVREVRKKSISI